MIIFVLIFVNSTYQNWGGQMAKALIFNQSYLSERNHYITFARDETGAHLRQSTEIIIIKISKSIMKKILLLMTMVLTCVGAWAQTHIAIGQQVTDLSTISADKRYALYVKTHHATNSGTNGAEGENGGFLYHAASNKRYKATDNLTTTTIAWTLTPKGTATFSFKSDGYYMPTFKRTSSTTESGFDGAMSYSTAYYKLVDEDGDGFFTMQATGTVTNGSSGDYCYLNWVSTNNEVWIAVDKSRAMEIAIYECTEKSISSVSGLENNKIYNIANARSTGKYLMYHPSASGQMSCNIRSGYDDITYGFNVPEYQWAIYKSPQTSNYYMYSIAANKFVGTTTTKDAPIPLTDVVANIHDVKFKTESDNASYPFMMTCNDGAGAINTSANHASGAINWQGGYGYTNDGGNQFRFEEVGTIPEDVLFNIKNKVCEKENGYSMVELDACMNWASECLQASSKGMVGYPIAEQTVFNNLRSAWSTIMGKGYDQGNFDYNATDCNALFTAYNEFVGSTDVKTFEDGKAYVIRNVQKNGNEFMLTNDHSSAVLPAATESAVADYSNVFICRVIDAAQNQYSFVNAQNGLFMVFHGVSGTKPCTATGFETYNARGGNECNLVITSQKSTLAGSFTIGGRRDEANGWTWGTMTISPEGSMNANSGSANKTYSDSWSSLFTFQEVAYPNNVKLTAFAGSELISNFGNGTTIGTFSAPFSTVIPSGVTAYFANSNEGEYIKLMPFTGAVPANQGVILVGESATSAFMIPATTETASVDFVNATSEYSNIFENTAGKTHPTVAGDYVLANGNQGVGFYETNVGGTLAMNKAFLSLSAQSVSAFRLVVDETGETTAIETVETEKANAPIYDLSGRRVLTTVKGGIYIQNGKKFIVK